MTHQDEGKIKLITNDEIKHPFFIINAVPGLGWRGISPKPGISGTITEYFLESILITFSHDFVEDPQPWRINIGSPDPKVIAFIGICRWYQFITTMENLKLKWALFPVVT